MLGVGANADPSALRAAHRRAIRRAHPDAGGSADEAARVNAAWALLRDGDPAIGPERSATVVPPDPPYAPAPRRVAPPDDVDGYYLVDAEPSDLLVRLAEAGHTVGEVVFVDPHVGILEIVVGDAPAVGQLAVTVGATSTRGTEVAFTLEPLGVTPAPPIGPVVDALMAAVRR